MNVIKLTSDTYVVTQHIVAVRFPDPRWLKIHLADGGGFDLTSEPAFQEGARLVSADVFDAAVERLERSFRYEGMCPRLDALVAIKSMVESTDPHDLETQRALVSRIYSRVHEVLRKYG